MPTKTPASSTELIYDEYPPANSDTVKTRLSAEDLVELQYEVARLRTAVEVLQRQNAELVSIRQAFEAERRRYREMFESAPDGYVLTTLGGVILEANYVAAALLAVRQDSLI